ncbi:unnamed protein product, partial [Pylaiella littoralis]
EARKGFGYTFSPTTSREESSSQGRGLVMAEGGAAASDNGGNGSSSSRSRTERSERRVHRQQQQQQELQHQQAPETRATAGSKRRRGESSQEANVTGDAQDENVDGGAADVATPAAKQARGLYGRLSGLVGRAVGLLTPGRPRAPAPLHMEDADDVEAGRAPGRGREEESIAAAGAAASSNEGTPAAAAAVDPAVGAALSSSRTVPDRTDHGVVDGDGADDAANPAAALLFSPGVGRRSAGPRHQTRGPRTGRDFNAASSSRRTSAGHGIGSASLRGSTAGDGGMDEFDLPPVPAFYPLGSGAAAPSIGGRIRHGTHGSSSGRRVTDGTGVNGGAAGPFPTFGGGASGPTGLSTANSRRKNNGKGRRRGGQLGGGGADELHEEEE